MHPDRTILIIGGKLKIVQKARALGLDVLYLQKKEGYSNEHAQLVDMAFLFDFEEIDATTRLARTLYEQHPFHWVVSLTEPGLLPAASVNDALSLGGNSYRTASLLMNKWIMREHLNAAGFSHVAAARGTTRADLHAFIREHGLPVIIKPIDRNSSLGVMRISGRAEIDTVWSQFTQLGFDCFVVEEFLNGPEFSVESFSFSGRHIIVAITQKLSDASFVEIGHAVPAPLSQQMRDEVSRCVSRFLDIVGLVEGPAHTELKITSRGPRIVESHNRVGGDRINEMVQIAYGVDLDTLTLGWPFRLVPGVEALEPRAAAAIRFFTPPAGRVRSIHGVESASNQPGVVEVDLSVCAGSQITSLRSNSDRAGYVLAQGTNVEQAIARCEYARDMVTFEMMPTG